MAAEKDIIVALELATTAIRAIAGQRLPDSTMQVIAYAEENATTCIRKGIIDNIDKTTQAISRVLGHISLQLGKAVTHVHVGIGGQSLHSVLNKIQRNFTEKTQVPNHIIDQIMITNSGVVYADSEILEVVPQEYKVGSRIITDIVGMQVEQLEANFLNIIARKSLKENIQKCVKNAGYEIADLLIAPLTLGDSVLSASEKRSGCALADIGADTTTISIYTNNILRKLIVLPIGANNVTNDIAQCLKIEVDEAEVLKNKYGRAWLEDYEKAISNTLEISRGKEITEGRLCEITEARYEEILKNIWAQIADDSEKLTSGIVFTGGGSQIAFLTEAFQQIAKGKPIRIVKGFPTDIKMDTSIFLSDNGKINTIFGLLLNGDFNCVAIYKEPITEEEPIVEDEPKEEPVVVPEPAEDEPKEEPESNPQQRRLSFWERIKIALTDDSNS